MEKQLIVWFQEMMDDEENMVGSTVMRLKPPKVQGHITWDKKTVKLFLFQKMGKHEKCETCR